MFQVGQTFLHFQWDILLLEAGMLGIILSPLWPGQQRRSLAQDRITMFLVRSVSSIIITVTHSSLQVALVPDDVCQWCGQGKWQENLFMLKLLKLTFSWPLVVTPGGGWALCLLITSPSVCPRLCLGIFQSSPKISKDNFHLKGTLPISSPSGCTGWACLPPSLSRFLSPSFSLLRPQPSGRWLSSARYYWVVQILNVLVVSLHILENFLLLPVFYNKTLTKTFG